jgi:hypothetical protein
VLNGYIFVYYEVGAMYMKVDISCPDVLSQNFQRGIKEKDKNLKQEMQYLYETSKSYLQIQSRSSNHIAVVFGLPFFSQPHLVFHHTL